MRDASTLKPIGSAHCPQYNTEAKFYIDAAHKSGHRHLYRVPEIVTRGRFPDGGESDSTWRTQEARHVGSDTIAPGF
jgi:hypothetical protein